ncbi:MAG: flagellar export protein FliJ [Bacillota bacterium]|jgi:flagellar FliJ protein
MKKFQFSMQKILEYKTHMEDSEKNTLQAMRLYHQQLEEKLQLLCGQVNQYQCDYEQKCSEGIAIRDLISLQDYIHELQEQINHIINLIEKSKQEIEQQINKLVAISKEKNSMDKLKEKHWEDYQHEQRKIHEVFIDEFISNANLASKYQIY